MRRRDLLQRISLLPLFGMLGCTPASEPEQEEPCCPTDCGEKVKWEEWPIDDTDSDDSRGRDGPVGCSITPTLELINIVVEFEEPSLDPLHNRYITLPQEVRIVATFKEEGMNMDWVWYGFNCWVIDTMRVRRCIMEMPWGSNVSDYFEEFAINLYDQTFRLASITCYEGDRLDA